MKQIFLILSLSALFFSSCDRENIAPKVKEDIKYDNGVDGGGIDPEFSLKEVYFSATTDSVILTSKHADWVLGSSELQRRDSTAVLLYDKYATQNFVIESSWYTLRRIDNRSMVVKVKENPTLQKREMEIPYRYGNWHGRIKVAQSGRK